MLSLSLSVYVDRPKGLELLTSMSLIYITVTNYLKCFLSFKKLYRYFLSSYRRDETRLCVAFLKNVEKYNLKGLGLEIAIGFCNKVLWKAILSITEHPSIIKKSFYLAWTWQLNIYTLSRNSMYTPSAFST